MAVIKQADTDQELLLKLTNGDLSVIKEIKEKWKFRNLENVIRFALAVLSKADNQLVAVMQGGKTTSLSPADSLLESAEKKPEETPTV